ncbi:alpha/beta fold hydrolase [Shewanella sp. AS1]|uniref:alpha/beta fold hydrolase n=1 Tax=Shewanella sp. AS1 TaxID=2907626 RepID=UPI001F469BD3|nr:alpha/beta fold hydrolase [Shewanella sp. AS1]MCE9680450.1 alpha/beta fold hydrolase [Shewanella sp. AS1]
MSAAQPFPAQAQLQAQAIGFSSEFDDIEQRLTLFWQKVIHSSLITPDKTSLAYCYIRQSQPGPAIVISSGRVESYLKYQELIFDLYQQGYSVYAIDHRGQGLSQRLTDNPHKGYVKYFDDYVEDFEYFIEQVVKPARHEQLYLVGHSMGSAIGTLYLAKAPDTFNAALLCAPMYGIKLPLHKRVIYWLARLLDNGSERQANYVLGGKDYEPVSFEKNELTHSEARYRRYRHLYQQRPELQLGSPTNRWLTQALLACDRAVSAARHSKTPILILQASEDSIVDNDAQLSAQGDNCDLVSLAQARHEIFIETDSVRDQALTLLVNFFHLHA